MAFDNLTREEARERGRLLSNVSYRVSLDLTTGPETFECETFAIFECAERGVSTFIDLMAQSVESITLNGREIPAASFDGHRINLGGLDAHNELRVIATCNYEHVGIGLHRFEDPVDGKVYLHTQGEPFDIHRVYPCFDQPDIKATFELSINAPEGWEVVSNGREIGRPEHASAGIWTFDVTPRIPTYITALVAGPYHVVRDRHNDIELGLYCRESLAEYLDPGELFEITRQGFDFFTEVFGYPYAFGKYDQLFVPEFNAGAMENSGCVTFNESFIFRSKVTESQRERRADVILHEMSHMWFGDLVTMLWWDDLWLNESFATFMATLSQVRATRFSNGWVTFANSLKASARRQDQLPTTHPIAADIPDIETCRVSFDQITYSKGASVLRQLVAWAGEDLFVEGVRSYFKKHEYANTELTDFLSAVESACGRDLSAWSREWLETAGVNTLRPVVELDGERIKSLVIVQEAPPEHPTIRGHRVAVGLYDTTAEGISRRKRIELDVVGERTEVMEATGQKIPDLVLVNDDDLTYAKIRLDERSFETTTRGLRRVVDPLARALLWAAAWDMLRDAELPAGEYFELVLANIEGESDIGVVQRLLIQADDAIFPYGDPAHYRLRIERLAHAAHDKLLTSDAGSDLQLSWARTLVHSARKEEHISLIRGWLEGASIPGGLEVDFDLRWAIVQALASLGAGEELISSELERDPTDQGKRNTAHARAASPKLVAKDDAWRAILGDPEIHLAMARATMAGFHRREQRELLMPFRQRYFEELDGIWESRDLEVAIALVSGLYPSIHVDEDTIRMTDEYLKRDIPAPIRRILAEKSDDIARALRARARDISV